MLDQLRQLGSRVLRMVAIGQLPIIDDTSDQQTAQVHFLDGAPDFMEEVIDKVPRLGEYGLATCPPDGAEAVVVFLGGRRSAGVIVATGHRASRPKGLKPGEVMLYNGLRLQFVELTDDGKIISQAPDWAHDGDLHVSGSAFAAHVIPADGASGTFTSQDGKTITVTDGIVTRIA